jgi:hypothetical protein
VDKLNFAKQERYKSVVHEASLQRMKLQEENFEKKKTEKEKKELEIIRFEIDRKRQVFIEGPKFRKKKLRSRYWASKSKIKLRFKR